MEGDPTVAVGPAACPAAFGIVADKSDRGMAALRALSASPEGAAGVAAFLESGDEFMVVAVNGDQTGGGTAYRYKARDLEELRDRTLPAVFSARLTGVERFEAVVDPRLAQGIDGMARAVRSRVAAERLIFEVPPRHVAFSFIVQGDDTFTYLVPIERVEADIRVFEEKHSLTEGDRRSPEVHSRCRAQIAEWLSDPRLGGDAAAGMAGRAAVWTILRDPASLMRGALAEFLREHQSAAVNVSVGEGYWGVSLSEKPMARDSPLARVMAGLPDAAQPRLP